MGQDSGSIPPNEESASEGASVHSISGRASAGHSASGASGHSERSSLDRGGVVTARGTGDGLVLRLDGRVEREGIRHAVVEFMNSRKSFLAGNEVVLEWVGGRPDDSFVEEISETLRKQFNIDVRASRVREQVRAGSAGVEGASDATKRSSLFDGIEAFAEGAGSSEESAFGAGAGSSGDGRGVASKGAAQLSDSVIPEKVKLGSDPMLWDDPDARIIYSTLRSGQRVETEHSIVICGDVNSGAEVVAGGDIIVLGILRGVAHAGAYDETGGGRFIFGLNLQPTQLRIGTVISRGASDVRNMPEIARVDGSLIVVEPYNSKNALIRRVQRRQ